MSLDYNLGDITNFKKVCLTPKKHVKPKTEAIIWVTMLIEMGTISEHNYKEFYRRVHFYQLLFEERSSEITLEDIKAHVGLRTNVINKSNAAFRKRMWEIFSEEQDRIDK